MESVNKIIEHHRKEYKSVMGVMLWVNISWYIKRKNVRLFEHCNPMGA